METMVNSSSKRTDREVHSAIAGFLERGHGVSYTEIADSLDCSRLTVIRSVARLQKANRLRIVNEKGKPNRYEIL